MSNIYQDMRIAKDECYTTSAEADKLVDFLLDNKLIALDTKIWLPFDTEFSRIYLSFKNKGFKKLIRTSLAEGMNFYHFEPEAWDVIISNPPFSGRTKLLKRLFSFNKPFIILQGTQFFNNQFAVNYLCKHDEEVSFLFPEGRMSFMTYNEEENIVKSNKSGAAFYSFWFCFKVVRGGYLFHSKTAEEKKRPRKWISLGM
ncbi:MAG: hypothetical protein M0Q41_13370 [Bacteroidales bacterium]|nr:hypothetical protein [Acholeplasmataceae bacterium]MCK9449947.1 hypothetical protein [Bacteroidales bacterium]